MVDNEIGAVRDELLGRLQRLGPAPAAGAALRELHSVKGIAQAYGLTHFAEAVHLAESAVTAEQPAHIDELLAALCRELEASVEA